MATSQTSGKSPVTVTVLAQPGTDPKKPDFTHGANFPSGCKGKLKKNVLWFDETDGMWPVEFDLDDRTGLHLEFKGSGNGGNPAEAIWIAAGTNCPAGQGNANGAFDLVDVRKKKLTITNNGEQGEFTYRLNFTSDDGDKDDDPVIKNGGLPPIV